MNKKLAKLESELQKYIIDHGSKGEQILGMVQRSTGSKIGSIIWTVLGLLLTFLLSFLALLAMYKYQVIKFLFPVLLVIDVLIHLYVLVKALLDIIVFGDCSVSYFFVTTHALYECNGFHCCCIYSWSFDELVMLEYGEGKVIATSKYWLSDAPEHYNKSEDELSKLNRDHVRWNEPIERRNFSFSSTIIRPSESTPGGGHHRVGRRRYRHNNAPLLQTKTLHFSSDSEMPELCAEAASKFSNVKIKKIGTDDKIGE